MTRTLVLLAHPEPRSFTGAWADATAAAARAAGHAVTASDLVAEGFDPVERPGHYAAGPGPFDPLKAQEAGRLPADIAPRVAQVQAADRIVFHFPIWWFGPPAILMGWCDRVLVHGVLHDVDHRFDRGPCAGTSALFCVTTGASAAECGPDGREGDARLLLWPLAQTLRYLGMEVLEPVLVHGVHGYHEGAAKAELEARLAAVLDGQAGLIGGWDRHPRWPFNPDSDFDAAGRLRPGAPSHDPFIRHPGPQSSSRRDA